MRTQFRQKLVWEERKFDDFLFGRAKKKVPQRRTLTTTTASRITYMMYSTAQQLGKQGKCAVLRIELCEV